MQGNGHLTNEQRAAYWQRRLAPAALLEMSDHLQECSACREQLRRDRPPPDEAEAVGYEELVAWMDEDLDPPRRRELAERIGNSPASAAELVNLLQFRAEMNELPASDYSVGPRMRSRWPGQILALAAGLALGGAVFWWTSVGHRSDSGLVLIDQGRQLVVRANGEIPQLGALPADLRQSVQDAVSSGKIDCAAVPDDLRGARATLAGAPSRGNSFRVVDPVGRMVETDRPGFRWSEEPGATEYRVNYLRQSSGEVTTSPLLGATTTNWTPNESLLPNETYQWEVEALRNGEVLVRAPAPPEPEARFRLLDRAARAELQQARARWAGSHLLMGLACARAGLLDEARQEFAALARENPQSDLPKKLLAGLTNPN